MTSHLQSSEVVQTEIYQPLCIFETCRPALSLPADALLGALIESLVLFMLCFGTSSSCNSSTVSNTHRRSHGCCSEQLASRRVGSQASETHTGLSRQRSWATYIYAWMNRGVLIVVIPGNCTRLRCDLAKVTHRQRKPGQSGMDDMLVWDICPNPCSAMKLTRWSWTTFSALNYPPELLRG